jgi:hypothetical protein
MLLEPPTSPEQWCALRPCVRLGGVVLDQPFGSALVCLLALLWLYGGWRFWRSRGGERSRFWWACALGLGGVAAALAGTSYQAFGYELKCAGRPLCLRTSRFEVAYLVLQNASTSCIVVAVAHACAVGRLRRRLIQYAALSAVAHGLVTLQGVAQARPFLLSFELLLAFSLPPLAVGLAWNGARAVQQRSALDRALVGAWLGILAVTGIYAAWAMGGHTERLWQGGAGVYVSENDVLHAGMIGWVLYVTFVVSRRVRDRVDAPARAAIRARAPAAEPGE